MAVANFQYITRMNSGFKVYILEGQPSLRTDDRYRQLSSYRTGVPPVYPIKRKYCTENNHSTDERPLKLRKSSLALITRERALFGDATRSFQKEPVHVAPDRNVPPVTAAVRSTSPIHRLPSPVYASPPMDEPLALIKKPGYCSPSEGATANGSSPSSTVRMQQMRPSVITCVSSSQRASSKSPDLPSSCCSAASLVPPSCDPVVEEHFRRSLGNCYREADASLQHVSVSVDDHFAKALGDKWHQIKGSPSPGSPGSGASPVRGPSPHSPTGSSHSQQSPASP
ncbi:vestigial like 4 like [Polypterus senegalus]|uniref:vestigial like 4 like n=1 Tax=Polypterus senegalus TaxID=55291 RepID=UPI001964CCA2|nr:vestigial like 4 like [Polypterus senegalus]